MQIKKTFLGLALTSSLAGLALVAQAADKVDASKLPAASTKKGLTFDKDIKPIFEQGCFKCHGPEKQKGKYRTDNLEAAIKGGESGDKAVIVGKSADSPLVHYIAYAVEDMEMPPKDKDGKSKKMSDESIGLIRAWIDQGAK